ncbi:MAG: protein kinase [Kofleriaceae bacterium]|nr:protein kinase [Kofleriaceae bacterium]
MTTPRRSPSSRDPQGRVLGGKYELAELIEFVGDRDHTSLWRGVVHGAAGFTRAVAIRRLPSATAAREAALRGAALEHANVVRVYDVVRDEAENLYLVMEWIDGVSLGELARGAHHLGLRVPWPVIGCIGVGALHGLAAGHAGTDGGAPIVHGHLSERSILIDRRGVVHLTPFGLDGAIPHLFSPRSPAGDLHDLAAALWNALAAAPQPEDSLAPPPSAVRDVLARALDLDVDRPAPASADELARELAAALTSVPWRRGPQADVGDAVREVEGALAWSPVEPYPVEVAPGAPAVLVHLSPAALAAARRGAAGSFPFDLSDTPGDDEPYAAYELRA